MQFKLFIFVNIRYFIFLNIDTRGISTAVRENTLEKVLQTPVI